MIRHGSSFFFSLLFHGILIVVLFFTWQNTVSLNKIDCEEKVCIQLCDVIIKKPLDKPVSKPKSIPKKIKKPKIKPKPIPKPVVKKIEILKEIPEVVPEIVEEIALKEEKIVEEIAVEVTEVEVSEEKIVVEDAEARQARITDEYLNEHLAKIRQLLQDNLYYPLRARKRGTGGRVIVKFTISADSIAHSIEVLSSDNDVLSRAAIRTVNNLSGKLPKPSNYVTVKIPIDYNIKQKNY